MGTSMLWSMGYEVRQDLTTTKTVQTVLNIAYILVIPGHVRETMNSVVSPNAFRKTWI